MSDDKLKHHIAAIQKLGFSPKEEPPLITYAQQWADHHPGEQATQDEQRYSQIIQALLDGNTLMSVSRQFKCSPLTLTKCTEALEKLGLLEPFDVRFKRQMTSTTMVTWEAVSERVASGELDSKGLVIMAGIGADKLAANPAQEVNINHVVTVDAENISTRLDTMKRAKVIDHGSGSLKTPLITNGLTPTDTHKDTMNTVPIDATFTPEEPKKRAPSLPKSLRKSLKKGGEGVKKLGQGGNSDVLPTK